jgi:hypothetical protein
MGRKVELRRWLRRWLRMRICPLISVVQTQLAVFEDSRGILLAEIKRPLFKSGLGDKMDLSISEPATLTPSCGCSGEGIDESEPKDLQCGGVATTRAGRSEHRKSRYAVKNVEMRKDYSSQ